MVQFQKGLIFLGVFIVICSSISGFDESFSGIEFDLNARVNEHPKFTEEQKIAAVLVRLYNQCDAAQHKKVPKQMVIDTARELVRADDEYKAQAHYFSSFCFYYPYTRDGIIYASGVMTAIFGGWLFS